MVSSTRDMKGFTVWLANQKELRRQKRFCDVLIVARKPRCVRVSRTSRRISRAIWSIRFPRKRWLLQQLIFLAACSSTRSLWKLVFFLYRSNAAANQKLLHIIFHIVKFWYYKFIISVIEYRIYLLLLISVSPRNERSSQVTSNWGRWLNIVIWSCFEGGTLL